MSISQKPSESVEQLLLEKGFKANGYDYYKTVPMTNLEKEWSEEVYVYRIHSGYEVWWPDTEIWTKNKLSEQKVIDYLNANFH
jgi:hypothetical protein